MKAKFVRVTKIGVSSVALVYVGACAWLTTKQDSLIFQPTFKIDETPALFGAPFVNISIPQTHDDANAQLDAWWVPAKTKTKNEPVLLYLHGASFNLSPHSKALSKLSQSGISTLIFDYRGYGQSTGGPPTEEKIYQDARAAWDYLVNVKKIDPKRIFIYGHSMGGAVAIDLASQTPQARGLIVESTFTSMGDVGRTRYPIMPVKALLKHKFDSLSKVAKIQMPVLLIHGTADTTVPSIMSEELYKAFAGPKRLVLIEGGRHNNCGDVNPTLYRGALNEFLTNKS